MDKSMFDVRMIPAEAPCGECGEKGFPEWSSVSTRHGHRFIGLLGFQLCEKCDISNVHLLAATPKDHEKLRELADDFQKTWRARYAQLAN